MGDSKAGEAIEQTVKSSSSNVQDEYYFSVDEKYERDRLERRQRNRERLRLLLAGVVVMFVVTIFLAAVDKNPEVFVLNDLNKQFASDAFNTLILLTIPFLLGVLGAVARLLLSGVRIVDQLNLIGGSALMASFSWIGIKSGVLISIVAPHLSNHGVDAKQVLTGPSNFYTMALVAVIVGMFSTNLYLFISERVEKLANDKAAKVKGDVQNGQQN